ncbi:MAG: hypothetical protein ACFCUI_04790 [Bernardetiaceae bacterium]
MKQIRIKYYLLFAVCFLVFSYVSDYVRPSYSNTNAWVVYVLGILPNFLPAIGIAALFYAMLPEIYPGLSVRKHHLWALVVALSGLILWEFAQGYTRRGVFDSHDILWTLIGGVVFWLIWRKWQ